MRKKGTEKPIEIFVALFVILAVALVMLRLFQNQVTQQQEEIQQFQQEKEQENLRKKARQHCQQKCTSASNDDCSLQSLASLCLAYGSEVIDQPKYLDLNMNQQMDTDSTLMPGVGVCEDAVPCNALVSQCCGQQITPKTCADILRNYWSQLGFEASTVSGMFADHWKAGTCNQQVASGTMWWELANVSIS